MTLSSEFSGPQELADTQADWDYDLWKQARICHILTGKSRVCKAAKARRKVGRFVQGVF
jgi:hypothetical protein